jgi:hypothetical protein
MLEIPFESQSVCVHLTQINPGKFLLRTKKCYELLKVLSTRWINENHS